MNEFKEVTFEEVKTGEQFRKSMANAELLERLFKGEVKIIDIHMRRYPTFISLWEAKLLSAYDSGKEIPDWLQDDLKKAIGKREEYTRWRKDYGLPSILPKPDDKPSKKERIITFLGVGIIKYKGEIVDKLLVTNYWELSTHKSYKLANKRLEKLKEKLSNA